MIAGFPTETEAMFGNSLKLVDEAGLSQLHVFPFSPRPGTPAAKMPQLPRCLVKERAGALRAKGKAARDRRLDAMKGSHQIVLTENGGHGHTPCFARVILDGQTRPGEFVPVTVTGRSGDHLTGIAQ